MKLTLNMEKNDEIRDRVIMDIAGHVSPRMLRRYSHIQLEAKRTAIQAISNRPKTTGSRSANVTCMSICLLIG